MWELLTNKNIRIHPSLGAPKIIGRLDNNWLIISDEDCYHNTLKAYGLDNCIIIAPKLEYEYIRFLHGQSVLETTRLYFYDHSVEGSLYNSRKMIFLYKSNFGLAKAIKYGKNKDFEAISQLDIFDLHKNDVTFEQWNKANHKQIKEET